MPLVKKDYRFSWEKRSKVFKPAALILNITILAGLHDQIKSVFFGGPAFFQLIKAF